MKSEDKQISLTDPDTRSMATSGKDTGIVGYNVQTAVDTKNHLIVAHEVTNVGTNGRQLSNIAEQARTEMGVETLDAVADRGYYAGEEIAPARRQASRHATKAYDLERKGGGRFGKQDFRYVAAEDAYVCPAGQRLAYSFTTEDKPCPTSLPDQRLSELRYQTSLHHRQGTTDLPIGARGRADCAGTSRSTSGNDNASSDSGTSLLGSIQVLDGSNALSHETAAESGNRDGAQCARLQHQARDGDHRRGRAAGGLGGLTEGHRAFKSMPTNAPGSGQAANSVQIGTPRSPKPMSH